MGKWARIQLHLLEPSPLVKVEECIDLSARAGHFWYFLIFSITKNDFLHFLSS